LKHVAEVLVVVTHPISREQHLELE